MLRLEVTMGEVWGEEVRRVRLQLDDVETKFKRAVEEKAAAVSEEKRRGERDRTEKVEEERREGRGREAWLRQQLSAE